MRKRFGTHSSFRRVAEYVVGQRDLHRFDLKDITIYEPFAGAGMFLVAALRHLRDQLPDTLKGEERHTFLVKRISGAELDSFACEVAKLSLILADYPNANGWKIASRDLFEKVALEADAAGKRIVLCNPPSENFDGEDRQRYPEMAAKFFSKLMAGLWTLIKSKPEALSFVSVVTVGELRFGLALARAAGQSLTHIEACIASTEAHPLAEVTRHTADAFATVKSSVALVRIDIRRRIPRWVEAWIDQVSGQLLQIDEMISRLQHRRLNEVM